MEEKKKEKSRASMIIDGDIEPLPNERYLLNLRKRKSFNEYDKEELREISRKGRKALSELHGERKTARQALENILSLKVTDDIIAKADIDASIAERLKKDNPDATFYDLIQAVAIGRAIDGSVNAMMYVRDTNGDKPVDKMEVTTDVMTDKDRELLKSISARLDGVELVKVVDGS